MPLRENKHRELIIVTQQQRKSIILGKQVKSEGGAPWHWM